MKFYLGVTDNNWYKYLSMINPEDVNFWQPGGNMNFKVLDPGAPFLFKLKWPLNAIAGIGFFSSHTFLPLSIAWDTFKNRNGCSTFDELSQMILSHRKDKININPTIGCIVLTDPIFFNQNDWIETPADWGRSIVQGKSYNSENENGKDIWIKIEKLLQKYMILKPVIEGEYQLDAEEYFHGYGSSILKKVRLGQGAFRVLVTDAYSRKCAVTGEKTLPVLEAAHIKPYSNYGPHVISNGILLRSDIHKLFDTGYLTITNNLKVEVSSRIKEEYQNGKEYYKYHGKDLLYIPNKNFEQPENKYIEWHNSNIYRG